MQPSLPEPPASITAILQTILRIRRVIDSAPSLHSDTKEALLSRLVDLQAKVTNKPKSLADAGMEQLSQFEQDQQPQKGEGEGKDKVVDEEESIAKDEEVRKKWKQACWAARRDMSEEEMLLLSEPTMRSLLLAYRCDGVPKLMAFWRYLVKMKAEEAKVAAACEQGPTPMERNAGAVVSSGAKASQRTEALPTGIEAFNYKPEVFSPTAAAWKNAEAAAAAATGAGTTRHGSSVRSAGSPKGQGGSQPGSRSVASRGPLFTQSDGWKKF